MPAVAIVRGAVGRASVEAWLAAIDAHPAWHRHSLVDPAFNRHSSSLRAASVPSLDLERIAATLLAGEVGTLARVRLGSALALDLDQCWIRRQYAPANRPPDHAPHAWHQDGALGFDFLGASPREGALLAMATCWIALTPCGADAPGIEFAGSEPSGLLPLSALADAAVRARHPERDRLRPILEAGDALVFGGGSLHHTHVADSMTRDRTSLELRFFPAAHPPLRLSGDRFLNVS
jgi:hypothetical protein